MRNTMLFFLLEIPQTDEKKKIQFNNNFFKKIQPSLQDQRCEETGY